ncbi:hypothetical protein DICVIV_04380 [Dictyocaulus viviparus]|uniref:Uncharacterized protein n=1 Tax=Dictyocaulus viviparus TaxID=29172 RepID=A0A0D8XYC9_DICVI|nr:hypothetical protein DICVIV_04380 [Dictyocaulus viviparus]
MGCVLCPNPDSSSAYNTGGESCRSNSITPDGTGRTPQAQVSNESVAMVIPTPRSPRLLHRSKNLPKVVDVVEEAPVISRSNPIGLKSKSHIVEPIETNSRLHTPGYADDVHVSSNRTPSAVARRFPPLRIDSQLDDDDYSARFRVPSLSIVMRDKKEMNNRPNEIAQRIVPMPKFFRSTKVKDKIYFLEKPDEKLNEVGDDHDVAGPSERNIEPPSQSNDAVLYKWKVKRRCDGTRYIVKRPIRNQILKKRAAQLVRERAGVSTDDDAMSELKLGHFHTREERKKHLEEERRRKIKNQQKLIQSKMSPADQVIFFTDHCSTVATKNATSKGKMLLDGFVTTQETIVQLSQRKMQRQKEKMLLDGFVTTQEVLSQRNPDTTAKHGLLSVTTV